MIRKFNEQIRPRNGHTLVVGIVARISGCQNQKELSLDDQIDHGSSIARTYYDGEIEFKTIATKGKGERLDRPELKELENTIRQGQLDLLIFEDVGQLLLASAGSRLITARVFYPPMISSTRPKTIGTNMCSKPAKTT